MWRLVLVSFIFLGWSFYELSGGADYRPAPNSIQAQARLKQQAPAPARTTPRADSAARTLAQVEAMMQGLGRTQAETEKLSVTLAAARADAASIIEAEASRPKAELLQLELPAREAENEASVDAAIAAAMGEVIAAPDQIRWVKESVVDLRKGPGLTFDRVTQITKGTEVAILKDPGNGWLNVQVTGTYETGWLAEWLVTKPE